MRLRRALFQWSGLCGLLILLLWYLLPRSSATLLPGFDRETVFSGLDNPVYLAELPDEQILVVQKDGSLFLIDPAQQPVEPQPYLTIENVDTDAERGVHSVALDPDFRNNGHLYVYYSNKRSGRNRIARFTRTDTTASSASEMLIWQSPLPWREDCCHYGGALAFGPDGKLYLATGDEFDNSQAQEMTRSGGKILRLNRDGSVPSDNPFADGPGGNLDEIWSLGLRNPFRIHWDLENERLYIGDVGGNVQQTAREDLHVGRRGAIFGWPYCEGRCDVATLDDPIYSYAHIGASPAGGAIVAGFTYRGSQFPTSFHGAFFFADYAAGWIRYLRLNSDGSVASVNDFARGVGAPVHLIQSRDGSLWYVDFMGTVGRITHHNGNRKPSIRSAEATPVAGQPPLTVSFEGAASDSEGQRLTYRWSFGDGTVASGDTAEHTYGKPGRFSVHLHVSDGAQEIISDPLKIDVGDPPVAAIDEPGNGLLFQAGDTIAFRGRGSDPDGDISELAYRWDIDFIHNGHTHPVLSDHTGNSGTLQIDTTGHDYHDDTGYRIRLQVTDGDGLIGNSSVTIRPRKVALTLSTTPVRIPIALDGIQMATPLTYDTMVGFRHTLSASPTTCVGSTAYQFTHWSHGGERAHSFTVPDTDTALTAHFSAAGGCNDFLPTDGLVVRLESDTHVDAREGKVHAWRDQLDSGLTLSALGHPMLEPDALNGLPAIRLDGVDDRLSSTTLPVTLPTGNADREIYTVVRYLGVGYGGISYGRPADNQVFGLLLTPGGKLMTQGWGYRNDFPTEINGNGTGWMIDAATLSDGWVSRFKDGVLLARSKHIFNTADERLVVGAEIDASSHIPMQVAAILVYDRALDVSERDAVYRYLNNKYLIERTTRLTITEADEAAATLGLRTRLVAAMDKFQRWQAYYASKPFIERQRCVIKQMRKETPCADEKENGKVNPRSNHPD